jgi:hypothetical protein
VVGTAGKNYILHTAAAQVFYTLFPKNPADRINYIALPATVWTNNNRNPVLFELQIDRMAK